jgi:Zn-dependent protease
MPLGRAGSYKGTAAGFGAAVAKAYGATTIVLAGVGFCVWARTGYVSWLSILFAAPLCMLASFVLHELGHVCMARLFGLPVVLWAAVGYMAVVYQKPTVQKGRIIALAGPGVAAGVCGLAAATTAAEGLYSILFTGLALIHALNLLPFTTDGRHLWSRNVQRIQYDEVL